MGRHIRWIDTRAEFEARSRQGESYSRSGYNRNFGVKANPSDGSQERLKIDPW
jgi:hypothetical protein